MSLTSFIIVSFYLLFFAVCPSLQRSFLLVVVLIPFCCYGSVFPCFYCCRFIATSDYSPQFAVLLCEEVSAVSFSIFFL